MGSLVSVESAYVAQALIAYSRAGALTTFRKLQSSYVVVGRKLRSFRQLCGALAKRELSGILIRSDKYAPSRHMDDTLRS